MAHTIKLICSTALYSNKLHVRFGITYIIPDLFKRPKQDEITHCVYIWLPALSSHTCSHTYHILFSYSRVQKLIRKSLGKRFKIGIPYIANDQDHLTVHFSKLCKGVYKNLS